MRTCVALLYSVLLVSCAKASVALATAPAGPNADPSPSPSPAPTEPGSESKPVSPGGGCDAPRFAALAASIEKERTQWSAAVGRPVSRRGDVHTLLQTACDPALLRPFRDVLSHSAKATRDFVIFASRDDGAKLACEDIADVIQESLKQRRQPGRSAFIFNNCDLGRFSTVVSRDEFVGLDVNSGAVTLLGFALALQNAGVAKHDSDVITRELVLASGLQPYLQAELNLPAGAAGETASWSNVVTLSKAGLYANVGVDGPELVDSHDALLDIVMEWRDSAAGHGMTPEPVSLLVDRDLPWTKVEGVASVFSRAKMKRPRLVVLVESEGHPFRSIPLPRVKKPGAKTVQELVPKAPAKP